MPYFSNTKDQGRKDTKNSSPKPTAGGGGGGKHQPRAITDKFDCYRVPLDQVQNLGGGNAYVGNFGGGGGGGQQQQQYYHFEQKYQATNTAGSPAPQQPVFWTAVPYNSMQYKYESYAHHQQQQQQTLGAGAAVQGPMYPLPQMDPNYYRAYPSIPPPAPPTPAVAAATPAAPASYGHAPYASPWVTEERPKSPAPVQINKANDNNNNNNDDVLHKLDEMHGQMSKMVRMLTEEINNNARNARRDQVAAQNVPKIEGGVRQFNVLLAQFNTLCKGIKEQKQQQQQQVQQQQPLPNQHHSLSLASRNETASTAFAATASPTPKSPKSGGKAGGSNQSASKTCPQISAAEQKQLAERMEQLNLLYRQAKALGVELHNSMLGSSSAALPSVVESTSAKKTT